MVGGVIWIRTSYITNAYAIIELARLSEYYFVCYSNAIGIKRSLPRAC